MGDSETEVGENQDSERLKTGSNQLSSGILQTILGLMNISRSFPQKLDEYPKLKWLLNISFGGFLFNLLLRVGGDLHQYFFGGNVYTSGDIEVGTFPFPVGLSLWVIVNIWFVSILIIFVKYVELRKRVDKLEQG